jgi:hypothetical protein
MEKDQAEPDKKEKGRRGKISDKLRFAEEYIRSH